MIRVIVVDDEILSRIGIQSFLEGKNNISVEGVFGMAKEALEFLKHKSVDIVITDIEMADMNGLEFIKIVREKQLASGVIIISCYDSFEYAREAIAIGTDQYMLKHDIDEKKLLDAIAFVSQKISSQQVRPMNSKGLIRQKPVEENGVYVLGILKLNDTKDTLEQEQIDETMVIYLLEGIVNRFKMGTLYSLYQKDIFVIFRFEKKMDDQTRRQALEEYIRVIQENISQYINSALVIGVSGSFYDMEEIHERYEEAQEASQMSFYNQRRTVFYYQKKGRIEAPAIEFTCNTLLETDGIFVFRMELDSFLQSCKMKKIDVFKVKKTLSNSISDLFDRSMNSYNLRSDLDRKWNQYEMVAVISMANNMDALKERLQAIISEFACDLQEKLKSDEFHDVFMYTKKNLTEKISLTDIANMKCMSVPSFCKKFKEYTGVTLVQYINQQRIEQVKLYLNNPNYTLGEIADLSGFSSENYMVRVFKKTTGQTITEYRLKHSIKENRE